jgi:DNA-binding SARP family transcriptional activator
MDLSPNRTRALTMGAVLAAATLLAYARVAGNEFTTFDDREYVVDNPHVKAGLAWAGVRWAFTTGHAANWHPLTWLSHMLDCQIFGMRAAGHHLMSLALHIATTLLLFHFFRRTTAAIGASTFVAAAFALHPLHVESVAWVSERKDVLCALFWVLTLLAYVRWVERPGPARYALIVGLFALGLLAKPMIVTLPFTLLLLDLWPLRRIEFSRFERSRPEISLPEHLPAEFSRPGRATISRLILEKSPLFALALASSVTTFLVQRSGGAMAIEQWTPFHLRLANAALSYVTYLSKSILPLGLAAYYPLPSADLSAWKIAGAGVLLVVVTVVAVRAWRDRPWLTVGWLWFLGTLVPVIGLVQVGSQAMADRYTYVPMIGLSVAVAWSARELVGRFDGWRTAIAALAIVVAGGWTALTWRQVGYWKDDVTLYAIAKQNLRDTYEAHGLIGNAYLRQGRLDEAMEELRRAVELRPSYARGHNDLGIVYELKGREKDAVAEYREALRWTPDFAEAHHDLAGILAAQGRTDEALEHYERAVQIRPDLAEDHYYLAIILLARGQAEDGIAHLRKAVELEPGDTKAQRALHRALALRTEPQPK